MQFGLRTRLVLGFGTVILLTLLIGVIGISQADRINARASEMYSDDLVGTKEVASVTRRILNSRTKVLLHIFATDPAKKASLEGEIAQIDQDINRAIEAIRVSDPKGAQSNELARFVQAWSAYQKARDTFTLPASRAGNTDQAIAFYSGDLTERAATLDDAIEALIKSKGDSARTGNAENIAIGDTGRRLIISAMVIVSAIELLLAFLFLRQGASLQNLIAEIQSGSYNLTAASGEILAATAQQSSGAAEQSSSIAETSATVNEVEVSAKQVTGMAEEVAEIARRASQVAGAGVSAVRDAADGMTAIRQGMHRIAEQILALSEQREQIGAIISSVTDLADQSNLLALNAAIEAARAGSQGKGFAVVATEIRNLADQSKAATAQIRTILADIQRATNAAVMATEAGTKGVDAGAQQIDQTGATIEELAGVVVQTERDALRIAAAVRQHAVGMEQIATAMASINQATAQSLSAATNTRDAAENLTELAGRLNKLVARYHV